MKPTVLIGSSIAAGLQQLRIHQKLKQGDLVLTSIPLDKDEALAVARACRRNRIYLCFSELLHRGGVRVRGGCDATPHISRDRFHSKADVDEIIDAAGEYYFGRVAIGEIGGVLYWPKAYTLDRRAGQWASLPACDTAEQAQRAYVAYCRKWLEHERTHMGKGPLIDTDSSIVFKYHAMAGIDVLSLEGMPGDPHLMHAAIRGAARAYDKAWGCHIAMQCYGGMDFGELWQKRWRTSLLYSFVAGANFVYPESGHYDCGGKARGKTYGFQSRQTKRVRRALREAWQFARIHSRPVAGPRTTLGVVHGHLDGSPGLWNRYAWGQYHHEKWQEGPPERGWRFVDTFHRKDDWPKETVQGDEDFSGNPPYGQYDVVPAEAPLEVLGRYTCLVFLGWNTMTREIYEKLTAYVKAGGHLVMWLSQLSTHVDRAKDLKLWAGGDLSDLFGVKITGKLDKDVRGVKCMADSSLKSYLFPLWRINSDPRFLGTMTPARVRTTSARVISGWSDFYTITAEQLARQPILVENTVGKGKAFLVTAWEYPADEGIRRLTEDVLRVVLQGEQGDIRLSASDRLRYAVYDGTLPGGRRKYSVIYLLNTDPDCAAPARLWVGGRRTDPINVGAGELRLAYRCGGIVLAPSDKCVDVEAWKVAGDTHNVRLFSARAQEIDLHNIGRRPLTVTINGKRRRCPPGERKAIRIAKRVDPARKEFFAADFLDEPPVRWPQAPLPY